MIDYEIHQILSRRGFSIVGNEYRYFCIYHHDTRTPNLHVNYQKGVYYCFACGAGGTLRSLSEDLGLMEGRLDDETYIYFKNIYLKSTPITHEVAEQVARERCLSLETILRMDMRNPPSSLVEMENYLLIPIKNLKGNVVSLLGYARGKVKPKYKHLAGARSVPFGLDSLNTSRMVFIVEGVFDAATAWEWGYSSIALLGTSNYDMFSYIHFPERKFTFVLAPDMDKAGQQALYKWAIYALLNGLSSSLVLYPVVNLQTMKDFNDMQKAGVTVSDLQMKGALMLEPAVLFLVNYARRHTENLFFVLYFLMQTVGNSLVDFLPYFGSDVASMLLTLLEKGVGYSGGVGKEGALAFNNLTNKDYTVLTVAATSLGGRRAISKYFLPSEVEKLFFFVPLVIHSSDYIPIFTEKEVTAAARRLSYIYRRAKGNSLLSIARYLRNLTFYENQGGEAQ